MKRRFKILDLFCGAGGAAMGYARAGFKVTGVDNKPQPHYPFRFIKMDAIKYVLKHGHLYDAIHASPPCQHASKSTSIQKSKGKIYIDLIPVTREALSKFKVPTIIENVPGAKIRPDIILKGYPFGLLVLRKRIFEINNCFVLQPGFEPKKGSVKNGDYYCIFGNGNWRKSSYDAFPKKREKTVRESWSKAMGIDWYMNEKEISQAIPPAYTDFIGKQIMQFLKI